MCGCVWGVWGVCGVRGGGGNFMKSREAVSLWCDLF